MKIEVSPIVFQVRIYTTDDDNYDIAFQVDRFGQKGFVRSLKSDKGNFYKNFKEVFDYICLECGISEVRALVMPDHAEVIKRLLSKKFVIEFYDKEINEGREMLWVRCAKK